MDTKRIAIITDSGTNVPPDFVAEHNIRITPLRINYSDGSSYESGITLRQQSLLPALKKKFLRLHFLLLRELKLPLMMQKQQGMRALSILQFPPDFLLPAILLA